MKSGTKRGRPARFVPQLWALMRPRAAILVMLLPIVGFGCALWERGSQLSAWAVLPTLCLLALGWLASHTGAMWLNAALDRDEGNVLLGQPVGVPPNIAYFGYLSLAISPLFALPLNAVVLACSLGCALLSILYSHPAIALKGHPLGGPAINAIGYGMLSPIAGFSAGQGVINPRVVLTWFFTFSWVLGLYFAAQSFQEQEDRERGYRTLVVTHGPRITLRVARACFGLSALLLIVVTLLGLYPRTLLIGLPFFLRTDRFLARWSEAGDYTDPEPAAEMVRRLAYSGLALLIGAYAHQIWQIMHGLPAGGMGTGWVP